jgi:hypothetical protein
MRFFVTSITTLFLVIAASTFAATKPTCAGTVVNVCGEFTFWVPDDWKPTKDSDFITRTTFDSADGNLSVVAGPLSDTDADLGDEEVSDFADEELDEMAVTADVRGVLEKFSIRLLDGTAQDEGDPVIFKMLALDPGSDHTVIAVLIYGSAEDMNKADNQATIDKILHSLRPQG